MKYHGNFSGGFAPDQAIDFGANTALGGTNIVISSNQGWEKRKGTDVINVARPIPKQLNATGWVGCDWDGGLLDITLLDVFDLRRWSSTTGVFTEHVIAVCKGTKSPTPSKSFLILFNLSGSTKFAIDTATHIPMKWGNAGGEDTVLEPKLGQDSELNLPYRIRAYMCQGKMVLIGYPLGSDATGENFTDGVMHWTDGTNLFRYGLDPATTAPTLQAGGVGTGSLEDGTYEVTAFYGRSGEYSANSLPVYSGGFVTSTITLTGGTSTQSIQVKPYYSRDPQIDLITICRTLKEDQSTFYEDEQIANDYDNAATQPASWTTLADSDNVISVVDNLVEWDNWKPFFSIDGLFVSNRGFYMTLDNVYYSKADYPEHVPVLNKVSFNAKGGENKCLAALKYYILVFRDREIWIIDGRYPDSVLATRLSDRLGIFGPRSFCSVAGGELGIFFSKEGFYVTDMVNLKPISYSQEMSRSINYQDIMSGIDYSRESEITAVYNGEKGTYMCLLPYLDGGYRIWVYSVILMAWVGRHEYPFQPACLSMLVDEDKKDAIIMGAEIEGIYSETTDDYFYLVQETDTRKDVNVPSDVASTYQAIGIDFYIPWYEGEGYFIKKSFRSMHIRWSSDDAAVLAVSLGCDFGAKTASTSFTHTGDTNPPDPGDDVVVGWDWNSLLKQSNTFDWGANDPEAFHYSVRFTESSQFKVKVFDFWVEYIPTKIEEQG